jgi:opacity protein-like surface antigen
MKKIAFSLISLGFLSANADFYLHGGIGLNNVKSELDDGIIDNTTSKSDLAIMIGLGYDLPIQDSKFSMGPGIDFYGTNFSGNSKRINQNISRIESLASTAIYLKASYKPITELDVYGKIGVGINRISYERNYTSLSSDDTGSYTGLAIGIGSSFYVTKNSTIFAEVLNISTNHSRSKTEAKVNIRATYITLGYRYFFSL